MGVHGESGSATRVRTRYANDSGHRYDHLSEPRASARSRVVREPRSAHDLFGMRSPAVLVSALCAGAAPVAFLLALLLWQQPAGLPVVVALLAMGSLLLMTGVLVIVVRCVAEQARRLRRHQMLIEQLAVSTAKMR